MNYILLHITHNFYCNANKAKLILDSIFEILIIFIVGTLFFKLELDSKLLSPKSLNLFISFEIAYFYNCFQLFYAV